MNIEDKNIIVVKECILLDRIDYPSLLIIKIVAREQLSIYHL